MIVVIKIQRKKLHLVTLPVFLNVIAYLQQTFISLK